MPRIDQMTYHELQELFHGLWSSAVGTPGYDKKKWLRMDAALNDLWRMSGQPFPRCNEPEALSTWERLRKPIL
jgi:hypothetical protein